MRRDDDEFDDEFDEDEFDGGALDELDAFGPRGLAFGIVLVAPLFLAYEWSLTSGLHERAIAERATTLALSVTGGVETTLRWSLLAAALLFGVWRLRQVEFERGRAILFALGESLLFAISLGPLLLVALRLFPVDLSVYEEAHMATTPGLAGVAYLFGCAAWEECLVRLGVFSAVYLLVSRSIQFLGGPRGLAGFFADAVALLLSALAFAALHLDQVADVVGARGEAFDTHVFLWRTLAGLALGGIYRWRGFGVGAWTHAFYNLGFALGASPAVFLVR